MVGYSGMTDCLPNKANMKLIKLSCMQEIREFFSFEFGWAIARIKGFKQNKGMK